MTEKEMINMKFSVILCVEGIEGDETEQEPSEELVMLLLNLGRRFLLNCMFMCFCMYDIS